MTYRHASRCAEELPGVAHTEHQDNIVQEAHDIRKDGRRRNGERDDFRRVFGLLGNAVEFLSLSRWSCPHEEAAWRTHWPTPSQLAMIQETLKHPNQKLNPGGDQPDCGSR